MGQEQSSMVACMHAMAKLSSASSAVTRAVYLPPGHSAGRYGGSAAWCTMRHFTRHSRGFAARKVRAPLQQKVGLALFVKLSGPLGDKLLQPIWLSRRGRAIAVQGASKAILLRKALLQ